MRSIFGKVVSNKMKDTLVVEVERLLAHPMYLKRVRRNKKYHVHTDVQVDSGARVEISPTRPYSKTKKFKLVKILK